MEIFHSMGTYQSHKISGMSAGQVESSMQQERRSRSRALSWCTLEASSIWTAIQGGDGADVLG